MNVIKILSSSNHFNDIQPTIKKSNHDKIDNIQHIVFNIFEPPEQFIFAFSIISFNCFLVFRIVLI